MTIYSLTRPFSEKIDHVALTTALDALRAGQLVAIPTETVYGLAADATRTDAVAGIFAAKGRPQFNPLICHVANIAAARGHGHFDETALRLAHAFWPGPLTLVVPRRHDSPICAAVSAGLDTIALRVPHAGAATWLSAALGAPLAAPSANRSGRVSATRVEHVAADLPGLVEIILDGGPAQAGMESTIIGVDQGTATLLRPGAIDTAAIEQVAGQRVRAAPGKDQHQPAAPGMLLSHYAPNAAVRLNATTVADNEVLLSFGTGKVAGRERAADELNLSPAADLAEAAANLFAYLRDADRTGISAIAVMAIPTGGLGEAINDRLRRAAAPRHPQSDPEQ
jgi:L-threonylcarbamoyladenylate synthase